MTATKPTSPSGRTGFTLIEVLMAMLVMTIGLLGLLQSVNVAYEHNLRTKLREEALVVAEEQMYVLRGMPLSSSTPYLNRSTAVKVVAGAAKKFTITRECQPMTATKRLKVTVAWQFKDLSNTHSIYTLMNR